jgi:hypothetical protein
MDFRRWHGMSLEQRYRELHGDPRPVETPPEPSPEPSPPPLTITDEQGASLRKKLALIAIKGSIENATKEAERERRVTVDTGAIGELLRRRA